MHACEGVAAARGGWRRRGGSGNGEVDGRSAAGGDGTFGGDGRPQAARQEVSTVYHTQTMGCDFKSHVCMHADTYWEGVCVQGVVA